MIQIQSIFTVRILHTLIHNSLTGADTSVQFILSWVFIAFLLFFDIRMYTNKDETIEGLITRQPVAVRWTFYVVLLIFVGWFAMTTNAAFIYFSSDMKKLFRNIALLLLIYIVISQVAVNSLPFSWGNTRLNTKYEEFKSRVGDFNTIFIGASTTYRHIDPTIFDSRLAEEKPDWHIHSFNFGIPANRTPQSIYALKI